MNKTYLISRTSKNKPKSLYQSVSPYQEGFLKVSSLHKIWYGQYGNPHGIPVVVLHGGPGGGCHDDDARYFDPTFWRVILLDQRAAKRSEPFAEMQENTTEHLISDLEYLRNTLNIDKWLVFGGSWGSTLALAYGETHPDRVLGFILRGIFLGRKEENINLWYGMRGIYPEVWQEFNDHVAVEQQHDLIKAYHQLIMSTDSDKALAAARSFMRYDLICSYVKLSATKLRKFLADDKLILGVARTFIHYSINNFFLKENQLIDNINRINKLPLIIVHGRYDLITLPKNAFELHQLWPGSELVFVNAAGHSAKEKNITSNLVQALEKMKAMINNQ